MVVTYPPACLYPPACSLTKQGVRCNKVGWAGLAVWSCQTRGRAWLSLRHSSKSAAGIQLNPADAHAAVA